MKTKCKIKYGLNQQSFTLLKLSFMIIISHLVLNVNSQTSKSIFLNKTSQHSLSAEFAAALSYSYAYKFKKDVILE